MGLPGPAARLLEDFTTFEGLPVPMSLVSCDGRLLRANGAMCTLLGRTEAELLGADAADLVPPDERDGLACVLDELLTGRTDQRVGQGSYVRPDGEQVQVAVRRAVVRDAQGTVALLVEHAVERGGGRGPCDEALEEACRRTGALLRVAEELTSQVMQPDSVATVAGAALHALLDGPVAVFLVDPVDGSTIEAPVVRTGDPSTEAELRRLFAASPLRTDIGLLGQVSRTGRPLVVERPFADAPPAAAEYVPWLSAHPLRALLLVPVVWGGRLLGVLAAGRHHEVPFSDDERCYAEQLGRQVATALADAQLLAVERSAARRERAVATVTRRCDEALGEPNQVLDAVVRSVGAELDGPCAAWLLDVGQGGDGVRVERARITHPDPAVEEILQPWLHAWSEEGATFLPRVLAEGQAFVVGRDEVAALANGVASLRPHAAAVAVESLYGVRLVARGQTIGLLAVASPTGRLRVEERRLVDALADRVALALDNARLLEAARSTRSQAHALVEHCSDLLLMADGAGAITYASPAARRAFGHRLGDTLLSFVVPADRDMVLRAWQHATSRPGPTSALDVRVRDAGDRARRMSVVANNLLDDPAVRGVVLTVRDVTEEREATARLAERAGQQAALAAIGATALTADIDELAVFMGKAIAETLESTTSGVLRLARDGGWVVLGGSDLRFVGAHLTPTSTSGLSHVARTGRPLLVGDYLEPSEIDERDVVPEYGLRSGVLAPVLVHGQVWGAVTAHSDAAARFSSVDLDFLQTVAAVLSGAVERQQMSERALAQASTDDLTGLPNRVVVQSRLAEAFEQGRPVALLLLDLDDFKDVNVSLGHAAGDGVLAQLGRRLVDVVGDRGTVARLGGDEFAVVLPGADERAAAALADDVARSVDEPFVLPGIDVTLSTSIGIATAPAHGGTAEHLLQAADMAMYRAKVERSGWAVYDAELDSRRSARLSLLAELRLALSSGQLVLYYQPLVDLGTGRVVEVEALLRWNHPARGLLLPGEFLPTAEQTDLVHGLTRYVVRAAARQAREWRAAGWAGTVAVNVSALALRPPEVVEALQAELLRGEGALTVELTESALVDDRSRDAVQTLAAAGIACSVDDFGTGWSSLAYLRELPVNRLKLDRAFNRDVDRDDKDAAIVGGVVQMAHAIGLDVVAEGVETPEVAARLRELGVDVAQGWLYGRPQPASALRLG
ncbi:MAG TPA: EAL domain-containing protein [Mycobacteriales bacterium]|nr:EAL domain-containing protein [Mycobacteriales bacterium]